MIHAKKLLKFNEIVHGFTTRKEGDFSLFSLGQDKQSFSSNNAVALLVEKLCLFCQQDLVLANQVHKDNIEVVGIKDKGAIIAKTDGLITKDKGVILGIRTADCCPIIFYEPVAKILGAVHAGWKGTSLEIAGKMIRKIGEMGGMREKIICVIGPHICKKCYDIPKERHNFFEAKYLKDGYLDLTTVNLDQLLKEGIRKENIEILPYCTYHQNEQFFSYRKNQKSEDYGEMLAYIGLDDG